MQPGAEDTAPAAGHPDPLVVGRSDDPPPAAAAPARIGLAWWVSFLVLALDQITKAFLTAMVPLYGAKTLVPGLIDLVHVRNTGVAFGFLNDLAHPRQSAITTSLALLALAGIAYYARHIHPRERWARLGLSLILGGAIGNLVDRIRYGFVLDFIDVYWQDWHFWAFNVADAAISIGAILVFLDLLLSSRHVSNPV